MGPETIPISSGDTEILAYLAEPSRAGRCGAVVVMQEVFGVNSHMRAVVERLAGAGYVAIAHPGAWSWRLLFSPA